MAGPRIAHPTLKGPSLVKEILLGIAIGIGVGSLWKRRQWNDQRKVRAFYDMYDRGEINVVAAEE